MIDKFCRIILAMISIVCYSCIYLIALIAFIASSILDFLIATTRKITKYAKNDR